MSRPMLPAENPSSHPGVIRQSEQIDALMARHGIKTFADLARRVRAAGYLTPDEGSMRAVSKRMRKTPSKRDTLEPIALAVGEIYEEAFPDRPARKIVISGKAYVLKAIDEDVNESDIDKAVAKVTGAAVKGGKVLPFADYSYEIDGVQVAARTDDGKPMERSQIEKFLQKLSMEDLHKIHAIKKGPKARGK